MTLLSEKINVRLRNLEKYLKIYLKTVQKFRGAISYAKKFYAKKDIFLTQITFLRQKGFLRFLA